MGTGLGCPQGPAPLLHVSCCCCGGSGSAKASQAKTLLLTGRNPPEPPVGNAASGQGTGWDGTSRPPGAQPGRFQANRDPLPSDLKPGKPSSGGAATPAWPHGGDQGIVLVPGVLGSVQAASPAGVIYPTAGSIRLRPLFIAPGSQGENKGLGSGDQPRGLWGTSTKPSGRREGEIPLTPTGSPGHAG